MNAQDYIAHTRRWLEQIVIGLNFCPFAAKPYRLGQIRIEVSEATTTDALSADLIAEGEYLISHPWKEVETTLLIHPHVLSNFFDYNEYLREVEALVVEENWEGVLQVASFHPHYQFGGEAPDAVSNYTNRSPYPMLHLIREERLEAALEHYEAPEDIPNRNIARLEAMGRTGILDLLHQIKPKSKI
ncbi:DUF1415 domain-containing protein [Phaeodactylibacter xiamenensis]|uniref:DUF1415 domain-containing protein n=1 Tax=Phaeodactylibacter xiamenensis TaxID=1524460 RepID=UPI003CCBDF9E